MGLKHMCVFQGIMFEITVVESHIRGSEITYVEDARVVESGARLQHTYMLRGLSGLKTLLRFDLKQTDGPELPLNRSRIRTVNDRLTVMEH